MKMNESKKSILSAHWEYGWISHVKIFIVDAVPLSATGGLSGASLNAHVLGGVKMEFSRQPRYKNRSVVPALFLLKSCF